MVEERRGFTLGGETVWLTLTELMGMRDGCLTKHVLAVWDNGERQGPGTGSGDPLEKLFDITLEKALITVYRSKDGTIVLGGLGWIERLKWETE